MHAEPKERALVAIAMRAMWELAACRRKGEAALSFVMGGLHWLTFLPYEYTLDVNTNTRGHTNRITRTFLPPKEKPSKSAYFNHNGLVGVYSGPSWETEKKQSDTPGVQNHLCLINMITGRSLRYVSLTSPEPTNHPQPLPWLITTPVNKEVMETALLSCLHTSSATTSDSEPVF